MSTHNIGFYEEIIKIITAARNLMASRFLTRLLSNKLAQLQKTGIRFLRQHNQ